MQGVPALKGDMDETTTVGRLSPSAEGDKAFLSGPSCHSWSWPNRDSCSGERNRTGCTRQQEKVLYLALGCWFSSVKHAFVRLLLSTRHHVLF